MKLIRAGYPVGSVGSPLLVTPPHVREVIGVSETTLRRLEKTDENFPRRVRITKGLTAWHVAELEAYFSNIQRVGPARDQSRDHTR